MAKKTKTAEQIEREQRHDAYTSIRKLDTWPNEDDCDYAASVLRASYYQSVMGWAVELAKQLRRGDFATAEDFRESMEQAIDGCQDVIYTRRAETVVYASDYSDEAREEWSDSYGKDGDASQIAYTCMMHDVGEELARQLECSPDEWFTCSDCGVTFDGDAGNARAPDCEARKCNDCHAADLSEGT